MADVKVKYLDQTGLAYFWGKIKENFVNKSTYDTDKAAFDKKYATSLDVTVTEDGALFTLKNAEGKIIPLGSDGSEASAVVLPVATGDEAGLMSAEDKARLDSLNEDYVTVEELEENEKVTAEALNDLNDRLNNLDVVVAGAKTYTVEKVTDGLGANVQAAYKLMETSGTGDDTKTEQVGSLIEIPKDSSLVNVELVDKDDKDNSGQFLAYTYGYADGTTNTLYVNVSDFLVEAEFGEGLQVSEAGKVSVKLSEDATTAQYLSMDENTGAIKFAGVPDVTATGDTYVTTSASGHAVTVGATEALTSAVSKANSAVQTVDVVASTYVSGSAVKGDDNKVTITLTDTIDTKLAEYVRYDEVATLSNDEIDAICVFE